MIAVDVGRVFSRASLELPGFLSSYAMYGAIGFRYAVLPALGTRVVESRALVRERAAKRAAIIGAIGAIVAFGFTGRTIAGAAARMHLGFWPAIGSNGMLLAMAILATASLVGFLLAVRAPGIGWPLAALATIALALRNLALGRFRGLINPVHVLAGGLWLGTLFVVLTAGLTVALRRDVPREVGGSAAAEMIHAFSPLALVAATCLALSGLLTAYNHIGHWVDLWTTAYGITLLVKLAVVATVVVLGAWNWRRMRPALGAPGAAHALRRTATTELCVALLVLIVTSVLVSLPAPREIEERARRAQERPGVQNVQPAAEGAAAPGAATARPAPGTPR